MGYTCPRCGFGWVENMGGTLEEAIVTWRKWLVENGDMRRDVRFVECGYVTPEAMREARALGRRTRILLAAAAL